MAKTLIVFTLAAALLPLQALAISLEQLPLFEQLVLSDRLIQIHEKQKYLATLCESDFPKFATGLPKQFPKIELIQPDRKPRDAGYSIALAESVAEQNLGLLAQVQKDYRALQPCYKGWYISDGAIFISPRSTLPIKPLFKMLCMEFDDQKTCRTQISKMADEVRPHCFRAERYGLADFKEDNACFGGDIAMDRVLSQLGPEKSQVLNQFSDSALARIQKTKNGEKLDLQSLFDDLAPVADPQLSLAVLAAIGTSGNSGLTGYLQSLEDRWLIQDITQGLDPKLILQHYSQLQQAKIKYQIFRDRVDQRHVTLSIGQKNINAWNRHNVMAAFLSCRFAQEFNPNVSYSFTTFLGKGYESKDFVSHFLVEHDSLKDSEQNYLEDTARYRDASEFTLSYCKKAK